MVDDERVNVVKEGPLRELFCHFVLLRSRGRPLPWLPTQGAGPARRWGENSRFKGSLKHGVRGSGLLVAAASLEGCLPSCGSSLFGEVQVVGGWSRGLGAEKDISHRLRDK